MTTITIRLAATIAATALVAQLGGIAWAAGPYPTPLPDFAHPDEAHTVTQQNVPEDLYNPSSGSDDRPVLVIYTHFEDVTEPKGRDVAFYRQQFFGSTYPSFVEYFRTNSRGEQVPFPASETQGTDNDGIVSVDLPLTAAEYNSLSEGDRNRRVITAADRFVHYPTFDSNADGSVYRDELIIINLQVDTSTPMMVVGARGVTAGAALDGDPDGQGGVKLDSQRVAMTSTAFNLMAAIHEAHHALFASRDLYGFGVGTLDMAGQFNGAGAEIFIGYTSWQKLHLGWIKPTVVTRDGFYTVRDGLTTGDAFILYDPSRGTDDYFIVENRRKLPGTYDRDISDSGLMIWRIDDDEYGSETPLVPPIELLRPDGVSTVQADCCYGGHPNDGWDPSDPNTRNTTMDASWRDGTPARVAVRAIGPAGTTIQAYFDVRGPGVLVDPRTNDFDPYTQTVPVDLRKSSTIGFSVMNTGETTDTFRASLTSLPAGWSATSKTVTLAAGQRTTVSLSLTPSHDAIPSRTHAIRVAAASTADGTVASVHDLKVRTANDFFTCPTPSGTPIDRGCLAHGGGSVQADFDGDGSLDLAVAAPDEDVQVGSSNVVDAGAVNVVYGTPTGLDVAAGNQVFTQHGLGLPSGGAEARDRFGSVLAGGDFDRDGFDDLAIGAPGEDFDGGCLECLARLDVGVVDVIYGSASGLASSRLQEWSQDTAGIGGIAENFDHFGATLAAGRFGSTTHDDLAVAATDEDVAVSSGEAHDAGAVHVLYGAAGGLNESGDHLFVQGQDGVAGSAEAGDHFGSVLAAGEFDGDGIDNLAIGVPYEDVAATCGPECVRNHANAGVVQVLGSSASGATATGQLWSQDAAPGGVAVQDVVEAGDLFGAALATGRFDNGSGDDLVIAAPGDNTNAGLIHILYRGANGLSSNANQLVMQGASSMQGTHEAGDNFGFSLAAGDFDGQGTFDIAVGVPYEDIDTAAGRVQDAGLVHVVYGSPDGVTASGNAMWFPGQGGITGSPQAGALWGFSVAAYDFGSGTQADLAAGIPGMDLAGAADAGAVQVLNGSAAGITGTGARLWRQGELSGGAEPGDHLGLSLG